MLDDSGGHVGLATDILLIADDSNLRKTVSFMLSEHIKSPVPAVPSAAALREVISRSPRIVFVQDDLHRGDGIQLSREILKAHHSTVVLIARNGLRAVDAYDAGIPDFLLTPLRQERLLAALSRGLQRTAVFNRGSRTGASQPSRPPLHFKSKRGFVFVRDAEVLWISASANYLEVHCAAGTYRIRGTIADASARLEQYSQFLRIHRSVIINADYVREVKSSGNSDCVVVLNNLREFPVSRKRVLYEWMALTCNLSSDVNPGSEELANETGTDRIGPYGSAEVRPIIEHSV